MLETLDHTIRIGSTPTFLYFDLYLYSAYAAHYVYYNNSIYSYKSQVWESTQGYAQMVTHLVYNLGGST